MNSPLPPSCNTGGTLLKAALRKGHARWAVPASIIDTPSAPLSWKYHRSSLLKSADMCKEGTACVLFIHVRNFSWWDNQNKLSRKAISSLAELHTTGVSYYSSVNSQFPKRNRVLIQLSVSHLEPEEWCYGLRAACFPTLPFLSTRHRFCVLICFYFLTHLSPTTSLLNL